MTKENAANLRFFFFLVEDHTQPDEEHHVQGDGARCHQEQNRQPLDYSRRELDAGDRIRHPRLRQDTALDASQQ